jgi:hypothetical protein
VLTSGAPSESHDGLNVPLAQTLLLLIPFAEVSILLVKSDIEYKILFSMESGVTGSA